MSATWSRTELLRQPSDFAPTEIAVEAAPAGPPVAPAQRAPRRWQRPSTPLQWALTLSVGLHALLLLVQLADPSSATRRWVEDRLDVVLVNTQGPRPADKPQALAQANLAGGGDGAADERALSPLPPSVAMELGDAPDVQHRAVQALQQQQQALLAQLRRDLAKLPEPNPEAEAATAEGRDQAERRRQLLALMAQIERRVNENSAGPRQRYVSPATQEVVYAQYYDRVRRRIEARGTRDFPTQAGRKLYGQLTMNITVDADGRVSNTDVVLPSGSTLLDRRAVAIVRASAPFGPFSPAMRAEAEVLVISARFTFDRDHGVQARLQEAAP
jgi:protein TonB